MPGKNRAVKPAARSRPIRIKRIGQRLLEIVEADEMGRRLTEKGVVGQRNPGDPQNRVDLPADEKDDRGDEKKPSPRHPLRPGASSRRGADRRIGRDELGHRVHLSGTIPPEQRSAVAQGSDLPLSGGWERGSAPRPAASAAGRGPVVVELRGRLLVFGVDGVPRFGQRRLRVPTRRPSDTPDRTDWRH